LNFTYQALIDAKEIESHVFNKID